jgi:transposase InsO family protein
MASSKKRSKKQRSCKPYPFELRLRAVKLYLEEGLRPKLRPRSSSEVSAQIKSTAIKIKQDHPEYGQRRISDLLKRFFFIKASPKTVGKALSEQGLTRQPRKKPKKNPQKPRFFERSTPNQLWQSDILTFRLAGKNAYLIGYIDDYSRYITSLQMFRSQTAENVIETLRTGMAEYGVPKEMLTDNGRQYTNWRGTTRFEKELKKEKIKHIRSRPHHPMTLGKIERFWKTILNEFLQRSQFVSWEEAQQRLAFWIKYYNYKRPHQGIGGLCPADRYFEIQHTLRKTLEHGVEENALELALRGKPADPFYMVGRMGDQSVVIRAEKGKVKMLVDDPMASPAKELVYDMKKDITDEKDQKNPKSIRSERKNDGCPVRLDGVPDSHPGLQGDVCELVFAGKMARSGHGGDAQGTESGPGRAQGDPEYSPCASDRQEGERFCGQTGKTAQENSDRGSIIRERSHGRIRPETGRNHHEGQLRIDDGHRGSKGTECLQENLLQMGKEGSCSPTGQCDGPEGWTSRNSNAPEPERAGTETCESSERKRDSEKKDGTQGYPGRRQTRHGPGQKKIGPLFRPYRRS